MTQTAIGRIVQYRLTERDADKINRRRTTSHAIAAGIADGTWVEGAQAHIGNDAQAGDIFPAIIVRVWPNDNVNLQVFLDGNDTYWATTVPPVNADNTSSPGCWNWPARE